MHVQLILYTYSFLFIFLQNAQDESDDESGSEYVPETDYSDTSEADSLTELQLKRKRECSSDRSDSEMSSISDTQDVISHKKKRPKTRGVSSLGKGEEKNSDDSSDSNAPTPTQQSAEKTQTRKAQVKSSSNTMGVRVWDKTHCCVYCGKMDSKMARHLELKHKDELEVAQALSFPKKSKSRKLHLDRLRYRGDYHHNMTVLREKRGYIIPWRSPPKNETKFRKVTDYLPCRHCLAFFLRWDMWRHDKACPHRSENKAGEKGHRQLQQLSMMLLPAPDGASRGLHDIMTRSKKKDDIYLIALNDPLIMKYGSKLFHLHGHQPHLHSYISQKVREIARLVKSARKVSEGITNLHNCINPAHFKHVAEAARKVAGFRESDNRYGTPSLALKLGFALRKCGEIVLSEAYETNDQLLKGKAKGFIRMYEMEWKYAVSSHALRTLEEQKWQRPSVLPLTDDVVKLQKRLEREASEIRQEMAQCVTKERWFRHCKVTLAQVTLFNRRRGGEVQRLKVNSFRDQTQGTAATDDDVLQSLSTFEKHLCNSLTRVVTRGKRGRKVPILLTASLKEGVDLLVNTREEAGINPQNEYVFARAYNDSEKPMSAHSCLHHYANDCGANFPKNLTTTRLRKHIATMTQLLNLDENQLEQVADYMGHTISVHRGYYRLPENTLQTAKVAKLLMAMEKGNLSQLRGKSLDSLNADEQGNYM